MSIVITLPGADKLLDTSRSIEQAAIDGDAEEEIECYNSVIEAERSMAPELLSLGDDVSHPLLEPTSPDQTSLKKAKTEGKVDPELVERLVKEKSRNVVVTHTQEEYARYATTYLLENKQSFIPLVADFMLGYGSSSLHFVYQLASLNNPRILRVAHQTSIRNYQNGSHTGLWTSMYNIYFGSTTMNHTFFKM